MDFLCLLCLGLEATLIVACFLRYSFLPSLHILLLYLMASQITFLLYLNGYVENLFVETYSNGGSYNYAYQVFFSYFLIFAIALAAHTSMVEKNDNSRRLIVAADRAVIEVANKLFVPLLAIFLLIYASIVDWAVIWSNDIYLAMLTPAVVADGSSFATITNFLLPVGIGCAALGAMNLIVRAYGMVCVFAAAVMFIECIFVGAHSRGGAALPITFAFVLLVSAPNRFRSFACLNIATGLFVIVAALAGRATGHHGIATIPDTLVGVFDGDRSALLSDALTNLCEGIFVFAESIQLEATGPTLFKLLNFSPTPAIVDGFDNMRELYELRLSAFAPMSGFVEAYSFGWFYVCLLIVFVVGSIRFCFRISGRNSLVKTISNVFIVVGVITLGAYPLRNGTKLIWIGDVIAIAYLLFQELSRRVSLLTLQDRAFRIRRSSRPSARALPRM